MSFYFQSYLKSKSAWKIHLLDMRIVAHCRQSISAKTGETNLKQRPILKAYFTLCVGSCWGSGIKESNVSLSFSLWLSKDLFIQRLCYEDSSLMPPFIHTEQYNGVITPHHCMILDSKHSAIKRGITGKKAVSESSVMFLHVHRVALCKQWNNMAVTLIYRLC